MICGVVVDVIAKQVNRSFDYNVPSHLEKIIKVGHRVKVLFGRRLVVGFVVEIKEKTDYKKTLNSIVDIIDINPPLNEEFIELAKCIAENNFSFYASSLQTMLPGALKIKYQKVARVINDNLPADVKAIFGAKKEVIIDGKDQNELKIIYKALEDGYISLDTKFKKTRNEKMQNFVYVLDDSITPSSKQGASLLKYMIEIGEPIEKNCLIEESGFSKSVIDTLIKKGILGVYQKELLHNDGNIEVEREDREFTLEQANAYNKIKLNTNETYLLHGVTGSGKTMIYIRLIMDVLKLNKTAIMLVPEISLTPQITALFKAYFQENVVIMHSRLSTFERYSAWKKVINGDVSIVIGARSAIFAPLNNLGIIIIDEEHEKSYIQENNPKYDAKEIAKLRGKKHNCPVILGSATPNVCDYYAATKTNEYVLIEMPNRILNRPLPECEVVDMANELKQGNKSVFSKSLREELLACYERKEQAILFLNRRGYSSFVMCRSCGDVVKCPHCDVSLTYHSYNNTLKCHHCGYEQMNVFSCKSCGSDKIRYVGSGTQKVMEEIGKLLPEGRVLRVDVDTTKKAVDYDNIFKSFKNHEADILVGTQMIAKGLDFSLVTLVGVVNADLALHYPSYDASMTAYNLIEQVSGRAGRGERSGKVIIQTYKPNHYVIQSAKNHNYKEFYNQEIAIREVSLMPPFSTVIEIMVSADDASVAYEEAKLIVRALKNASEKSIILGPAEALPFKLADNFRFTVQVKVIDTAVLDKIKEIYPMYQANKKVNITISRM